MTNICIILQNITTDGNQTPRTVFQFLEICATVHLATLTVFPTFKIILLYILVILLGTSMKVVDSPASFRV